MKCQMVADILCFLESTAYDYCLNDSMLLKAEKIVDY